MNPALRRWAQLCRAIAAWQGLSRHTRWCDKVITSWRDKLAAKVVVVVSTSSIIVPQIFLHVLYFINFVNLDACCKLEHAWIALSRKLCAFF
jgi:hypothetical protein